jgi:hypothetical protein
MRKILLIVLVLSTLMAHVSATESDPIAQAKTLLDQYAAQVKYVQSENAILREEMRKAGIKIPLSAFSGIVQTAIPVATGSIMTASGTPQMSTVLPAPVAPVIVSGEVSFVLFERTYGTAYTPFVKRIISDWDKIVSAYALPKTARIGGYEFVQTWALDHVFVDIVYTGSVTGTGIYDAKILYQFDKTTYARKLIGYFEYNKATGYYTTKTGKNIFPGVKRIWVADPRSTLTTTPATATGSVVVPSTVLYTDIDTAYTAKRYLSVISLSNSWMTSNAPTLDVLRIRYRTYFIIGKYTEALGEIEKIRGIWQLSAAVACEGYVIATYAKDTVLTESYKATCNKK